MRAGRAVILRRILRPLALALALAVELYRIARSRVRLALFRRRDRVIEVLGEHGWPPVAPARVLVAITHVVPATVLADEDERAKRVDKLANVVEGLLRSFAHCELELVLNTVPGQHVVDLPRYQRERIEVREHAGDPRYVGFKAQDQFAERVDDFDWFLYVEDDVVIHDSSYLDKLAFFNRHTPPEALLLPHRYEMNQGKKIVIDSGPIGSPEERPPMEESPWNRLSEIALGELTFVEFANVHAGQYCLSQQQLRHWLKSGRHWYGRHVWARPEDTVVTACLFEAFTLYKPHPANRNFFEVQHWDVKYSQRIEQQPAAEAAERV